MHGLGDGYLRSLDCLPDLYDAIMLYAHAATTVVLEGGDLRDGEAVTAALRSTKFTGVGGSVVALDSKGDRIESYKVMSYVAEGDVMSSVGVGFYNRTAQQYIEYERAVVWPGGATEVPVDYVAGVYFDINFE